MRVLNRVRRDEDGAVAVVVALLMVVLLGFGAFAVDAGYGYAVKREASTAADAASLAGAQAAAKQFAVDGWKCTSAVTTEAKAAAIKVRDENTLPGTPTSPDPIVTCDSTNRTIDVEVTVTTTIPTFFGHVLNVDSMDPGATATAQVSGNNGGGGLRPLGICAGDFPLHPLNTTYQSDFPQSPKKDSDCGGAPGNFGLISFISSAKTDDIERYMEDGYPGPGEPILDIPGWIPAKNGGGAVVQSEDEAFDLVNQTGDPSKDIIIGMPVFDMWNNKGGFDAEAHVTGIVSAKLCAYTTDKGDGVHDPSCWIEDDWNNRDKKAKNTFQWQFVEFTPAYTYGAGADCKIGPSCVPVVRLVK